MVPFNNYNIGKKLYFPLFLKNITFTFLIWTFFIFSDVGTFNKVLEYKYEKCILLNVTFNRLLAIHEHERGLKQKSLREKLPDRIPYKEKRYVSDNITAYTQVKRTGLSNIEQYMKNYKHRYGKKNGLSKLECYYENKVFGKFNHICDVAKNMQYDKKRSKKFFLKKYGICLIILASIPALGLIFPILFGISKELPGAIGLCSRSMDGKNHFESNSDAHKTTGDEGDCLRAWFYNNKGILENIGDVSKIFTFTFIIIFLLVLFYILIKIIKYEKIKAGKGKMGIKEYCRFCKEIF